MIQNDEQSIWGASQSQASNFWLYTILALLSLSVVAIPITLIYFLCVYFITKNIKYNLSTQRLQTHKGVFSKQTDDLELYRVIDTRLERPFILRLFGLGNVVLITADSSSPKLTICAVERAGELRDTIRDLVEKRREAKKVREFM